MAKSLRQLEEDFLDKARASARMPSTANRKAARKAYEKLPEHSQYIGWKFEG